MGFEPVGLESAVSSALDAVYEMVEARGRWGFGIGEFGTDEPGTDEPGGGASGGGCVGLGRWLVENRECLDRGEAEWLERLAEFDREQLWALDGAHSCSSWLMWRARMARSTSFERLRVAHEVFRRPIIADAFRAGVLSYSAVRIISRMDSPSADVDRALVELASTPDSSLADIERVVRAYGLYASQERLPADRAQAKRGVRICRGENGSARIVITLSDLEVEEFAAALQAFIDLRYRTDQPVDESPRGDSANGSQGEDPVDESPRGDCQPPAEMAAFNDVSSAEAPMEQASRSARTADAFMDMVAAALRSADGGGAAGDDRYVVHLVTRIDSAVTSFLDGKPIDPEEATVVACDTATVAHGVGANGEPLALGRRSRAWSTAERRAIRLRDGGHCRFPGCTHTFVDIHHIQPWEHGGPTDVVNGCLQCRRHHRMIHAGYRLEGEADNELCFFRPDSTFLGSTYPSRLLSATADLVKVAADG